MRARSVKQAIAPLPARRRALLEDDRRDARAEVLDREREPFAGEAIAVVRAPPRASAVLGEQRDTPAEDRRMRHIPSPWAAERVRSTRTRRRGLVVGERCKLGAD